MEIREAEIEAKVEALYRQQQQQRRQDSDDPVMLTKEERQIINVVRSNPWGEIIIVMKGGKPVMVKKQEDIKLSD